MPADPSAMIGLNTRRLVALLGALHVSTGIHAAPSDSDADLDSELKFLAAERQIVVTASKLQERIEKSVATTSVITQDEIRHIGARNLLDLLRLVPGLGITQSMIGVREVEVRGVKTLFSDKVLFMLNGHPLDHNLNNAGSTYLYDDLPVDTVKRIEIVRGPGSALYGANAFVAVVNIITLTAKDIDGWQASSGFGSFDTQQYRASWGKTFADGDAVLHFNHADTHGINAPIAEDMLSLAGKDSLAPGTSDLSEGRNDLEWQLGYQGFKLDGRYIKKQTGAFVGTSFALSDQTEQNYEDYFLQLSRNWQLRPDLTIDTRLYHARFCFDVLSQVEPRLFNRNALSDQRSGGELQGNYRLNDRQTLIAGFSYTDEQQSGIIDQTGTHPDNLQPSALIFGKNRQRDHWGLYLQDVWDPWPELRLTLGARYDEYNDFGGTFNPRIGFNWEFVKDYSLKFSYGTAYRAPAFGELDLTHPFVSGNPKLSPEQTETFETGVIARPLPGLTAQAIYYRSHISDLITLVPGQLTPLSYDNSGSMVSEGVELESRYDFSGELRGSYVAANVVFQQPEQDGARMIDVPRERANLMLNWAFAEDWSAFTHLLVKGDTTRAGGDARRNVPAYALVDLSLLRQNAGIKGVDVSFSVYNLFDQRYYDPAPTSIPGDYQQAGRAYFGHLSLRY